MGEDPLGDTGRAVTPDLVMQISLAVKAIALELGKKTKQNQFGAVYGEMYRKFGITGYMLLSDHKFEECMDWLTEWHQSLVDTAF